MGQLKKAGKIYGVDNLYTIKNDRNGQISYRIKTGRDEYKYVPAPPNPGVYKPDAFRLTSTNGKYEWTPTSTGKPTSSSGLSKEEEDFLAGLSKNQNTTYSGPSAPAFDAEAYLRELIGQIDLGYAKNVSQLEQGRASQMQRLMEQQNEFKNILARNRQTYEQGAAMAAQEIANRATAGQQRATELANQLANAMRLEGVSAQPLQAQAQLQQQLMQQSQGYQQDYQTRMSQLAAQRFADAERSSELIRQGAGGQLENQYRALQTALERQRLQDILGAQKQVAEQQIDIQRAAAAAARAAASSGGNSLRNTLLELQIAEKAQALQDPFGASIRKNPADWLALFQGASPEQQAAIAPYFQGIIP